MAIDAQLIPGGEWGGIEQFLIALVHALGKLDDGLEEYVYGSSGPQYISSGSCELD